MAYKPHMDIALAALETTMEPEDMARLEELHDAVEDLANNLDDAADTIERVAQAVFPAGTVRDVEAYREIIRTARRLL